MNKTYDEICKSAYSDEVVIGFNVFGYEDALEIVRAAEVNQRPVLLMTNRDACKVMEIEHWGALLSSIAGKAKVPVGVHLDHCSDIELIYRAIESNYTSVMYDGSKLPIQENIRNTRKIVEFAHNKGVFVEAEIGSVPYSDLGDTEILLSDPVEVSQLEKDTDVDILAISIGNIHRLINSNSKIDFNLLDRIEQTSEIPLVIHGGSGISEEDLLELVKHRIGKINMGTVIRTTFGNALRKEILNNPKEFDRLKLFANPRNEVFKKADQIFKNMK